MKRFILISLMLIIAGFVVMVNARAPGEKINNGNMTAMTVKMLVAHPEITSVNTIENAVSSPEGNAVYTNPTDSVFMSVCLRDATKVDQALFRLNDEGDVSINQLDRNMNMGCTLNREFAARWENQTGPPASVSIFINSMVSSNDLNKLEGAEVEYTRKAGTALRLNSNVQEPAVQTQATRFT